MLKFNLKLKLENVYLSFQSLKCGGEEETEDSLEQSLVRIPEAIGMRS